MSYTDSKYRRNTEILPLNIELSMSIKYCMVNLWKEYYALNRTSNAQFTNRYGQEATLIKLNWTTEP